MVTPGCCGELSHAAIADGDVCPQGVEYLCGSSTVGIGEALWACGTSGWSHLRIIVDPDRQVVIYAECAARVGGHHI